MRSIAYILTVHVLYGVFTANIDVDMKKEELIKLQKQKYELFKVINIAINETVHALENSNDTDAKQGIAFMRDLRQELNEINETEIDSMNLAGNYSEEITDSNKDNTTLKVGRRTAHFDRLKPRILDFAKIFNKKSTAQKDKYEAHRDEIHKKVAEWIEQRERERKKIRDYKKRQRDQMRLKLENCPDHGAGDKKKGKGGNGPKGPKYPCCRKCCKKSYMGCL